MQYRADSYTPSAHNLSHQRALVEEEVRRLRVTVDRLMHQLAAVTAADTISRSHTDLYSSVPFNSPSSSPSLSPPESISSSSMHGYFDHFASHAVQHDSPLPAINSSPRSSTSAPSPYSSSFVPVDAGQTSKPSPPMPTYSYHSDTSPHSRMSSTSSSTWPSPPSSIGDGGALLPAESSPWKEDVDEIPVVVHQQCWIEEARDSAACGLGTFGGGTEAYKAAGYY